MTTNAKIKPACPHDANMERGSLGIRGMRHRFKAGRHAPVGALDASRDSRLLGALPAFGKDPLSAMTDLLARGDGRICYMPFGSPRYHIPVFLVSRPESVAKVLTASRRTFTKSFTNIPARAIFGNGLLTSNDDDWVAQRRTLKPLFARSRNELIERTASSEAGRLVDRWGAKQTGQLIDVTNEMTAYSIRVLLTTIIGADISEPDLRVVSRSFPALSQQAWKHTVSLHWWLFPWLSERIPTKSERHFQVAVKDLDRVCYSLYDGVRDADVDSLLHVLNTSAIADTSTRPRRQARDQIATFLLAGHETTAMTLTWALYLLAQHPRHADRIAEESRGGKREYATAAIQETLRIYPPAWSIVRDSVTECEVEGVIIPKGSVVITSPYLTQQDPRTWKNPDVFDPRRFLREGEYETLHEFAYFPFGGGGRRCVGERQALIEATVLLVAICEKFHLISPGKADIEPVPHVTLRPNSRILLRLEPR